MLSLLVLLASAAGLLVGFAAGVRRNRAWGRPVVGVCALLLVSSALVRAGIVQPRATVQPPPELTGEMPDEAAIEAVGAAVAAQSVPAGARVVVFRMGLPAADKQEPQWRAALAKAAKLAPDRIEFVVPRQEGEPVPTLALPGSAKSFNQALGAQSSPTCWISLSGLPAPPWKFTDAGGQKLPASVIYFGAQSDADTLRQAFVGGVIKAAVFKDEKGGLVTATLENMDSVVPPG